MKWLAIGLFVLGAAFELLAWTGARRPRQSADVAMGSAILAGIGLLLWGLAATVRLFA